MRFVSAMALSPSKAQLAYLAERGLAPGAPVPGDVKVGFLRLAAETYFSTLAAAVRRADPNHMILGCRFAGGPNGVHPVVMEVAGRYCDVVSFNHYPWADLDRNVVFDSRANKIPVLDLYRQAHERAKKPFILTEWSFPALDTGRPCTHGAGQRFHTQAERVQATELYARTLLSLPYFAGYSYFRWVDQPALGISKYFPENTNYGLVTEQGEPYEALVSAFRRIQGDAVRWRAAPPPEEEPFDEAAAAPASERNRFFAAAGDAAADAAPVAFAREGDRWTLSNGLVRLSGRIGGTAMADEVAFGNRAVGRWGALLQWDRGGSPVWTDVSRVTDIAFERDETTGIGTVAVRAEGGEEGIAFAITHRLSLAPGRDEALADTVSLENTGAQPFSVQFLFLRPFAIEARPGETETVPNLWKGPVEDYWTLADGTRWGVASTDPGVVKATLWFRESDATQHPDVRCTAGDPFRLDPGQTYRPTAPMGARMRILPPPKQP